MKRFLSLFLLLVLLPVVSLADLPDISGLSFDELIELRGKIMWAIWACDEWKEVKVPAGVYKIGEDIPAGRWNIQTSSHSLISIKYGKELNDPETDIDNSTMIWGENITLDLDKPQYPHFVDITLKEGNYISFSGEVLFYPYNGKHKLDFN